MQAATVYALVIAAILVASLPVYLTVRASTKRLNQELEGREAHRLNEELASKR